MTSPKRPQTPGQHRGDLPTDPDLLAKIQQANAVGYDTCLASEYEAMTAEGVEPDVWRLAA